MRWWNRAAKGRVLAAVVQGLAGGLSVTLAIWWHRHSGWPLPATVLVCALASVVAVSPITARIHRAHGDRG